MGFLDQHEYPAGRSGGVRGSCCIGIRAILTEVQGDVSRWAWLECCGAFNAANLAGCASSNKDRIANLHLGLAIGRL
jgi:hypothetical protein